MFLLVLCKPGSDLYPKVLTDWQFLVKTRAEEAFAFSVFLIWFEAIGAMPASAAAAIAAFEMVVLRIHEQSVRIEVIIFRQQALVVQQPLLPLIHRLPCLFLVLLKPLPCMIVLLLKK